MSRRLENTLVRKQSTVAQPCLENTAVSPLRKQTNGKQPVANICCCCFCFIMPGVLLQTAGHLTASGDSVTTNYKAPRQPPHIPERHFSSPDGLALRSSRTEAGMKTFHKGSLFLRWGGPCWKEAWLARMMSAAGGAGEDSWLCESTGLFWAVGTVDLLPLDWSEAFLIFFFGNFLELHTSGIGPVKDFSY